MSLPQLAGMNCVACQGNIASILEGAFCDECGNPVHKKCVGSKKEIPADRCSRCGGDPKSEFATEVRRERGSAAQNLERAREQAASNRSSPAKYPVAGACPKCGSISFRRHRPEGMVAFAYDRICTNCGTRYTPPTPIWAAIVFILAGSVLAGFGLLSLLLRFGSSDMASHVVGLPAMLCEGFLTVVGLLALFYGFSSLAGPRS